MPAIDPIETDKMLECEQVMLDLTAVALQADSSRVVSLRIPGLNEMVVIDGRPLLESTIAMWGARMGDASRHSNDNLPTLVAGGAPDVDRLNFFQFDWEVYPDFDASVQRAAKHEIRHTFRTLLQKNLDARRLLKNDFVVVDSLLANSYGLQDTTAPAKPKPITGDQFRKVSLPADSPRGGLLGMAAVLAMGSNGERTSPVEHLCAYALGRRVSFVAAKARNGGLADIVQLLVATPEFQTK